MRDASEIRESCARKIEKITILDVIRYSLETKRFYKNRVLNPTLADWGSMETVFSLPTKLDSERLQTLATIARLPTNPPLKLIESNTL